MMWLSIDGLSIVDFRKHQISRSLGCLSPTSLCGGGGLRNRNSPFKGELSVQRQRKEEEKATHCFTNDDMLRFIIVVFESISTQLFQLS